MTSSSTYGDLQNRIADELGGRDDLLVDSPLLSTSPIEYAILDAISYWEAGRFYFNELRTASAFSTVAHQEFYTSSDYAAIPNLMEIDRLTLVVSTTNRYYLNPRLMSYLEDLSVTTTSYGQPTDFAYYGQKIRFYPIPDAVYAVNILGTKKFTELSATSDSNVWTTDAEALIRATAKWFLLRDTIQDQNNAAIQERAALDQADSLRGETFGRSPFKRLMPTNF